MSLGVMSQIKDGQSYIKVWPDNTELSPIFMERRVIKATQMAIKVMPFIAVANIIVQVNLLGMDYLPQAITFSLFFLSIPVQGLLWLGKRSNTVLPPRLAIWYRELSVKMQENGYESNIRCSKPRYFELAVLLKDMFDKMDKAFRQDML